MVFDIFIKCWSKYQYRGGGRKVHSRTVPILAHVLEKFESENCQTKQIVYPHQNRKIGTTEIPVGSLLHYWSFALHFNSCFWCKFFENTFTIFFIEYDSLISKTDFTSLWRGWKIHFWYASEDLFYANFMLPKPSRIYKVCIMNFYK